ncbi:hypothetical protein [Brunnivagina elsteri]|uniref:Uncharacterized protein n=1 Tax=Brunnivagina elsteri CCALA 953 TaxID=987040 RepID=A0A2A2TDN6_9CYAN|nr:hypothetical protein [Calothrix elsteri]PAX51745.1 hypothetical protein CK510_23095 [Calothrix elsteri CCALA 953]
MYFNVSGVPQNQQEICEINKSEKRHLCEWLCENGTAEDFVNFESIFALIEDIIGSNNKQVISIENDGQRLLYNQLASTLPNSINGADQ